MRVLVTRPEPANQDTAARLKAEGHDPILMPLLRFEVIAQPLPDLAGFTAIALTSANAVKALEQREDLPHLTHLQVFAVGGKTSSAAKSAGFEKIKNAQGTVAELAEMIINRGPGRLFYPAAMHRARDLEALLETGKTRVHTLDVYQMKMLEAVDLPIVTEAVDCVSFYSQRTARAFIKLSRKPLADAYLCLSENVAAPLRRAGLENIHVADAPNQDAMMKALLPLAPNQTNSD